MSNSNVIHYGFGKDYLPHWSIREALREVYQNFIDYGPYNEFSKVISENHIQVSVTNNWMPESLDFLRIGNSNKGGNLNAIGKHGEGLKMAFLIFERLGLKSRILTDKYVVYPSFYVDQEIGECFSFKYTPHKIKDQPYTVQFVIDSLDFMLFRDDIVSAKDVIFSHNGYGDIVEREQGHIYSGGLFVTAVQNLSRAYNIKPEHLPLDRDRSVPRSFDVNWAASRILETYEKWNAKDLTYSDTEFINRVPESLIPAFKPKMVGNSLEFIHKDEDGKVHVVTNSSVKKALGAHSFFEKAIQKLKSLVSKKVSIYDLLVEFKKKHVHSSDALSDFQIILDRIKA